MKDVLTSKRVFLFSFVFVLCCGKKGLEKNEYYSKKDSVTINLPFVEKKEVLATKENLRIEINKLLTKDSIEYRVGFENGNLYPIPIHRSVNDFEPVLNNKLNHYIENSYYKTPDSSFVVKYTYGTGNIEWNLLYTIRSKTVFLNEIFYIEPFQNNRDTITYISNIKVKKAIGAINLKILSKSMKEIEEGNVKNSKYVLKK